MNKTFTWLTMKDGTELYVRYWKNHTKEPKAIVQLAHGMAEHIERYDDFARFLVENDIFVFGDDHRGHGNTGEKAGAMGYFADENGFDQVVDDLYQVTLYIKEQYPTTPLYLLGHSLGSFLARRYIQKYSTAIDGVILSGTGGNPGIIGKLGKLVARREMRKNGKDKPSQLMDRMIFGGYNRNFQDVKNKFAWLSRDEKVVEQYIADPYCGFVCSSGFFDDLLTGLELIHNHDHIREIRRDLPFLFISGEKDPVGGNAIGVRKAIQQYRETGLTKITNLFYKDARHEVLNELNKDEVYADIMLWLNGVIE